MAPVISVDICCSLLAVAGGAFVLNLWAWPSHSHIRTCLTTSQNTLICYGSPQIGLFCSLVHSFISAYGFGLVVLTNNFPVFIPHIVTVSASTVHSHYESIYSFKFLITSPTSLLNCATISVLFKLKSFIL